MPHPVFAAGNTAVISGAASGIGLAVARNCATAGMSLALIDVSVPGLEAAKAELEKERAGKIEIFAMDVGEESNWHDVRAAVEQKFEKIHFLFLNAGTMAKGGWDDVSYFQKARDRRGIQLLPEANQSTTQIFKTNFFGILNGLSTFLPHIQNTAVGGGPTAIVLTGSKQGITNPPGNPAYNASKSAVKTAAEHLAYDLRNTTTAVHLLVPGWTFTGMTKAAMLAARGEGADGAKELEKPAGAWAPEQVAEFLGKKMEEGQFYVICPDNDVTEELDKKRMLWSVGDVVEGRPPLSRWREDWKDKAAEGIKNTKV